MSVSERIESGHQQVTQAIDQVERVRQALDQAEVIVEGVEDVLEFTDDVLAKAADLTRTSRTWLPFVIVGATAITGVVVTVVIWRRRRRRNEE